MPAGNSGVVEAASRTRLSRAEAIALSRDGLAGQHGYDEGGGGCMSELWRDLVDLLRRKPLLWVPVLAADLLGYLVNLGRIGLLRALVLHRTMQHSALGGALVQTPMSAAQAQNTTIQALLLSWFSYFLRILLFSGAFVVTAALVWRYLRHRTRTTVPSHSTYDGLKWGGILELALRALAIYATAALLLSWLTAFLAKHGYTAVLRNAWFGLALGLIVLLLMSIWLPPVALRVLADRVPDKVRTGDAQLLAASLAVVVTLLSAIVGTNAREMAHVPPAARYPLEIIGSLVVALPYVLLFTGLALMARKVSSEANPGEAI